MMLPADIKEAATIERRKRAEQERKGRIFNARQRLIGVRISQPLFTTGDANSCLNYIFITYKLERNRRGFQIGSSVEESDT